jgi:hypothetical protein
MTTPAAKDLLSLPASVTLIQRTEFANSRLKLVIATAQVKITHNWAKSVLLEILAWLAIPLILPIWWLISFVLLIFALIPVFGIFWFFIPFVIAVQIVASIFYRLRRTAQRYRLNTLADLRKDGRDPVLYLRSFYVDTAKDDERLDLKTDEEVLTLALREIGPVLAIGSPDRSQGARQGDVAVEDRPLLGATRIYFADEDWQEAVAGLMELSRLVVINAGTSDGLLWEMKAAVKRAGPSKLLISFLPWQSLKSPTREARYRVFRDHAERIFQEALQTDDVERTAHTMDFNLPETLGDASFFFFSKDWKVEPASIGQWKRLFYFMSPPTLMRETLRSGLRKRGVEPKNLKTNIYCLLAIYTFATPIASLWLIAATQSETIKIILYPLWLPAVWIAQVVIGVAVNNWLTSWLERRREGTYIKFLPED